MIKFCTLSIHICVLCKFSACNLFGTSYAPFFTPNDTNRKLGRGTPIKTFHYICNYCFSLSCYTEAYGETLGKADLTLHVLIKYCLLCHKNLILL